MKFLLLKSGKSKTLEKFRKSEKSKKLKFQNFSQIFQIYPPPYPIPSEAKLHRPMAIYFFYIKFS